MSLKLGTNEEIIRVHTFDTQKQNREFNQCFISFLTGKYCSFFFIQSVVVFPIEVVLSRVGHSL